MRLRTSLFLLGASLCVAVPRLSAQAGPPSPPRTQCPTGWSLVVEHGHDRCVNAHGGRVSFGEKGAGMGGAVPNHQGKSTPSRHTAKCVDGTTVHVMKAIAGCARHGGVAHQTKKP